jgi:hypothetical protein
MSTSSQPTEPIRHCVDCRHFIQDTSGPTYGRCSKFESDSAGSVMPELNWLVVGGPKPTKEKSYQYCTTARDWSGACGIEAKFFEGKENQ